MVEVPARIKSRTYIILLWVASTLVAGIASLLLANSVALNDLPLSFQRDFSRLHGDSLLPSLLAWGLSFVSFLGLLTGVLQGLALMLVLRRHAFLPWIAICALAVPLAFLVSILPFGFIGGGAVLGFAQWIYLRQITIQADGWVIASVLAWIVAVLAGWGVFALLLGPNGRSLPYFPVEDTFRWLLSFGTGILIYGLATGVTLALLLEQPRLAQSGK